MCGIVGVVDYRRRTTEEILDRMTDRLTHRGPDDRGTRIDKEYGYVLGMGHRRLSIQDLSPLGHQPMSFEHLDLVYNGEVYNFAEIRLRLEREGYTFVSHSDTEVILKAFHRWGLKAVHDFIGMFALALHDRRLQKLYLLRDRTGIKPLYYHRTEDFFCFGSELKAFHEHPAFEKTVDGDGLACFLRYGYILTPYTIFRNTYKLEAGCWLEFDLKHRSVRIEKYWDVYECYNRPKAEMDEEEALEKLESLLENAFAYRMVSDVPVGVFLSGGYDSTCVTALLQKKASRPIKTFTIGFEAEGFNEAPLAKEYAKILGTDHHEHICTESDAMEIIPDLPDIYDEPFGDSSAIPTTLVSRIAKQEVDVALSADGSDEIFAGYNKHFSESARYEAYARVPRAVGLMAHRILPGLGHPFFESLNRRTLKIPNFRNKVHKFSDMIGNPSLGYIFDRSNHYFTDREIRELIRREFDIETAFDSMNQVEDINDPISKILAVDYKTYLPDDILTKVDRATMSVSLEGREPFLDHRIVEFAAQLPIDLKYRNQTPKYLIKKIVHKYIPQSLIDRPKKGFSVPITQWYDNTLRELFSDYLRPESIRDVGILDAKSVANLLERYEKGEKFLIKQIWFVFVFQMWAKRWL